eukprot:4537434-Alexandrium_andersonii.AAC.1
MMRFNSLTSCRSPRLHPKRPSTLHMKFSFMYASTTSKSGSHPVNVKKSPCTTHRTPNPSW